MAAFEAGELYSSWRAGDAQPTERVAEATASADPTHEAILDRIDVAQRTHCAGDGAATPLSRGALRRFCVARDWSERAARAMVLADLDWRATPGGAPVDPREHRPERGADASAADAEAARVAAGVAAELRKGLCVARGRSRRGRPVLIVQTVRLDPWARDLERAVRSARDGGSLPLSAPARGRDGYPEHWRRKKSRRPPNYRSRGSSRGAPLLHSRSSPHLSPTSSRRRV